ncbi:hypothetical protein STCU_11568 [Strigomonas culicis]|uniref:Uncharacterized protein n=1 Tax=Strigomonas culicis TaxID=28005 RepID=S9UZY2_9TRYP|nr:hypothetical protein STCU_11568 [Strigomonas culicis]|eukprot:EPY16070.1 hypothetical protein STCU_11568 [Strigomonas culicis]
MHADAAPRLGAGRRRHDRAQLHLRDARAEGGDAREARGGLAPLAPHGRPPSAGGRVRHRQVGVEGLRRIRRELIRKPQHKGVAVRVEMRRQRSRRLGAGVRRIEVHDVHLVVPPLHLHLRGGLNLDVDGRIPTGGAIRARLGGQRQPHALPQLRRPALQRVHDGRVVAGQHRVLQRNPHTPGGQRTRALRFRDSGGGHAEVHVELEIRRRGVAGEEAVLEPEGLAEGDAALRQGARRLVRRVQRQHGRQRPVEGLLIRRVRCATARVRRQQDGRRRHGREAAARPRLQLEGGVAAALLRQLQCQLQHRPGGVRVRVGRRRALAARPQQVLLEAVHLPAECLQLLSQLRLDAPRVVGWRATVGRRIGEGAHEVLEPCELRQHGNELLHIALQEVAALPYPQYRLRLEEELLRVVATVVEGARVRPLDRRTVGRGQHNHVDRQ